MLGVRLWAPRVRELDIRFEWEIKFPPEPRKTLHKAQARRWLAAETIQNQRVNLVRVWPSTCIYAMSIK